MAIVKTSFSMRNLLDSNGESIPAEAIFGKDTKRLYKACRNILHCRLYEFQGCYISELRPNPYRCLIEAKQEGISIREFLTRWYSEHPEEMEKEEQSRKDWKAERDRQFRIVYGIAKRHHVFVRWEGKSYPDGWTVFKGEEEIAFFTV